MDDALPDIVVQIRTLTLLGVWFEIWLYGIYVCLFTWAINLLWHKLDAFSSKVFFVGSIVMFVLISFFTVLVLHRLGILAFGYAQNAQETTAYIFDMRHWESMALPISESFMIWTGDALVIYRCFIIWQRNRWIIALPLLLFFASMGCQCFIFWLIVNQSNIEQVSTKDVAILRVTLPLYVIQNILTTSLIVFKIWSRYEEAKSTGLVALNSPRLLKIARVIVESAALYTAQLLTAFVLVVIDHPAGFFVHYLMAPSTGIVFVMLTVRAHALGEEAKYTPASASLLPGWLFNPQHGRKRSTKR